MSGLTLENKTEMKNDEESVKKGSQSMQSQNFKILKIL